MAEFWIQAAFLQGRLRPSRTGSSDEAKGKSNDSCTINFVYLYIVASTLHNNWSWKVRIYPVNDYITSYSDIKKKYIPSRSSIQANKVILPI